MPSLCDSSTTARVPGALGEPRLVAVVLTANEQHHIAACIRQAAPFVDAVIVWDSMSRDDTCRAASEAGALVVQRPFDNFAAQRQAVLDTVQARWILFVDADERVTPALGREILARLDEVDANPVVAGFWIPRRNFIAGREVRGGGFYPDYQLRLLRRGAARYPQDRKVHEIVSLQGEGYPLAEPLIHYNYRDWRQFHAKQRMYAAYEAQILAARGIRARPHNFVLQPWREFVRRFVLERGFVDGLHGLRLCLLLAWYYGFMPYWHLWRAACTRRARG